MFVSTLLVWAAAQTSAADPIPGVPLHRWTVDYGRESCTLARRTGGERSSVIALNAGLGLEPGELLILDGGAGLDQGLQGQLTVRLDDNAPISLRASPERRNGLPLVRLSPIPDNFIERLAGADRLSVATEDAIAFSVPLSGAREATEELTRCNDDLLQSWGVDVAARRALGRPASLVGSQWAAAITPQASTYLIFLADVSERGRPTSCRIVVSSRNPRMDAAVCRLIQSRARFRPALDPQGRPVRSQYVSRIRWVIDGGGE